MLSHGVETLPGHPLVNFRTIPSMVVTMNFFVYSCISLNMISYLSKIESYLSVCMHMPRNNIAPWSSESWCTDFSIFSLLICIMSKWGCTRTLIYGIRIDKVCIKYIRRRITTLRGSLEKKSRFYVVIKLISIGPATF